MQAGEPIPFKVMQAARMSWGVLIDAYLINGARVGDRFTASAFLDYAGKIKNGETVVTPPLRKVAARGEFSLMQSSNGRDYYVLVSEYQATHSHSG